MTTIRLYTANDLAKLTGLQKINVFRACDRGAIPPPTIIVRGNSGMRFWTAETLLAAGHPLPETPSAVITVGQ